MSRAAAHPARSLDFLSRLHDGELTAAERAHFESHRAHCDECRRAAADFEATLAYYRTTGTPAAKPDLAARILRRLESTGRRRSPFGVVFGIDLKWAGAFATALIVTILGYSFLERHKEREQIRVSLSRSVASAPGPSPPMPLASPKSVLASAEAPADKSVPKSEEAKKAVGTDSGVATYDAVAQPAAPPPAEAKPLAPVAEKVENAPAPAAVARSEAAKSREAGGEGAAAADRPRRARSDEDAEAVSAAAPLLDVARTPSAVRLVVTALDGWGTPPGIVNGEDVDMKEEDRGRYVMTVGSNGVPLEVHREGAKRDERQKLAKTPSFLALEKLRFAAADRPRRLLVSVE